MRSATEQQAAERILQLLDSHTLAVRLAGAYAADTHATLEEVAAELEVMRLEQLETQEHMDPASRVVSLAFQQSVSQLSPGAQRLLGLLGAFGTGNISRNAVLEVAQALELGDEEAQLDQLVRRAFIEVNINKRSPITADPERVQMHPLLRGFADVMLQQWPAPDRAAAYKAMAQYYVEYANATPDRWLGPDEANMLSALEWAHEQHELELVAGLCAGLQYYWRDRGRIPTSRRYLPWGVDAAEAIAESTQEPDDHVLAVHLALSYGNALKESGELDKAEEIFQRNLALRRKMGDRTGEGRALCSLGQVTQAQGKLAEAEGYYQEALEISQSEGDRQSEGANLTYLGQVAQARGRITEAESYFQRALVILHEVDDLRGEGADLSSLAKVALARRQFDRAETLAKQSLAIRREMEDVFGEGAVLSLQGQIGLARGDLTEAEDYLWQSITIRRSIEDHFGEAEDLSQFGRLYLDRGQFDASERFFMESLDIFRTLRARAQEGVVLSQLGLLAIERGRLHEAERLLEQSRPIRREVQDRRGEGVDLALLGRIELERRHYQKAAAYYTESLEIAREVQNQRGAGVNIRQLGVIAEKRRRFKQAEAYYREALAIARRVENGLDIADTALALGSFLCRLGRNSAEGCALLQESIAAYVRIGAPGEALARQQANDFGCLSVDKSRDATTSGADAEER